MNIQDLIEHLEYLKGCYGNLPIRITRENRGYSEYFDLSDFDVCASDDATAKEHNTFKRDALHNEKPGLYLTYSIYE